MSTQTLAKPRQTGAQEARAASEAEAPMKLFPAKAKLDQTLADYQLALSEVAESEAHLARAGVDEQEALESSQIDEDRVAVAQRNRQIYLARTTNREATVKRLFGELESSIRGAQAEFAIAQTEELARRKAILIERVCAVIKAEDRAQHRFDWMELMDYSEPYQAVRTLEPASYQAMVGNVDYTLEIARATLQAFEKLSALKGAVI